MTSGTWFDGLTTPLVADAQVRLRIPLRAAPRDVRALWPGMRVAGPVIAVRHFGSVDVFLEAFELARPGGVLVIDNDGRDDEACIGDLTVLEARLAGLLGVVVWGCHRDTQELRAIGWPVFSSGALSAGPRQLRDRDGDPFTGVRVGNVELQPGDVVMADDDGVLFVAGTELDAVLDTARSIATTERAQADAIRSGTSLRDQLGFGEYLAQRRERPELTFREHLRRVNAAIEE
jgi:regulator of RNase E activity RraA